MAALWRPGPLVQRQQRVGSASSRWAKPDLHRKPVASHQRVPGLGGEAAARVVVRWM